MIECNGMQCNATQFNTNHGLREQRDMKCYLTDLKYGSSHVDSLKIFVYNQFVCEYCELCTMNRMLHLKFER